jgi:hypothetical protein
MEFSLPGWIGTGSFGTELAACFLPNHVVAKVDAGRAHRKRRAARVQECSFGRRWFRMARRCRFRFSKQPALQAVEIDIDDRRRIEGENL